MTGSVATGATEAPRGLHLLTAAFDVVADRGLGGLSVRSVAAVAGVSPAQVQYYFPTKAKLVHAAFEHAGSQFLDGVADLLAEEPSLSRLRRLLGRWLPDTSETERRARVWLAFSTEAATDPALASRAATLDAELRSWLASELSRLVALGELDVALDPTRRAGQILALLDGLVAHCLVLPMDARQDLIGQVLDTFLDELVT